MSDIKPLTEPMDEQLRIFEEKRFGVWLHDAAPDGMVRDMGILLATVHALRAALMDDAFQGGWKTIDTAPRNHLPILVYGLNGPLVAFRDVTWTWWPKPPCNAMSYVPTHWMPLPAPPGSSPPAVPEVSVVEDKCDAERDARLHAFRRDYPQFDVHGVDGQWRCIGVVRQEVISSDWHSSYDAAIDAARAMVQMRASAEKGEKG